MNIRKICVIGAGTMGAGIAQVCAQAGYLVILRDISPEFIDAGLARIREALIRDILKGRRTEAEAEAVLNRISSAIDLEAAAEDADIVVEAVSEVFDVKASLFRELGAIAKPECLFFSNTSGLSISDMATASGRPDRFLGTHFFNPVPVIQLLEIIRGKETSLETLETARAWGKKLRKEVILVKDAPAFAVNRILCPMINEAFFALDEGVATAESLDKGMSIGCNHPVGPLALADLIGLDTLLWIMEGMYRDMGEKYRPAPLLARMVEDGRLGKKTGRGVYNYPS